MRADFRLLSRILIKGKERDEDINQFSDFIQPSKVDLIMDIIPELAAYDVKGYLYNKPSTARDIGLIILHITEHHHHDCLKSKKSFDKNDIENFVFLMKHDMEVVNKLVAGLSLTET